MTDYPLDPKRPDGKCAARTRSGGKCTMPAGWGTEHVGTGVCRRHGGANFPQQQQRHDALVARREVADVVARWDIPADVSTTEFFDAELRRSAAALAFLDGKVAEQTDTQLVFGVTKVEQGGSDGGKKTTLEAKPSIWWRLWQEERKHGLEVAKAAATIDLESAKIRVDMATAEALNRIVTEAVRAAGGDVEVANQVIDAKLAELDERAVT